MANDRNWIIHIMNYENNLMEFNFRIHLKKIVTNKIKILIQIVLFLMRYKTLKDNINWKLNN